MNEAVAVLWGGGGGGGGGGGHTLLQTVRGAGTMLCLCVYTAMCQSAS